jgi:hypothetical protein
MNPICGGDARGGELGGGKSVMAVVSTGGETASTRLLNATPPIRTGEFGRFWIAPMKV